jgi:DNA-binding CsgD family transcriptional regulator
MEPKKSSPKPRLSDFTRQVSEPGVDKSIQALAALRSLATTAAILDVSGVIIAVNDEWKAFGRKNDLRIPRYGVGLSYLNYCAGDSAAPSGGVGKQIGDLIAGRIDLLSLVYPCDSPTESRWFVLIGVPLSDTRPTAVALLHVNLTEMVPTSQVSRSIRVGLVPDKAEPSTIGLDAVTGSVEQSVAETLSSELMTLWNSPPPSVDVGSSQAKGARAIAARLSKRQLQVLRLLGEGKTNAEIAAQLFRSPHTIKLHVSAILQRLELKTRTQAALLASQVVWPPPTE